MFYIIDTFGSASKFSLCIVKRMNKTLDKIQYSFEKLV